MWSVRHPAGRHRADRVVRPLGWAFVAVLAGIVILAPASIAAGSPPNPSSGVATVDGKIAEWSLAADLFSDMSDAGYASRPVVAHLYLRYDCASGTLFALVLGVGDARFLQTRPEDAYLRIGDSGKIVSGQSGNDGTPPDFAWVNGDGKLADGYEASAPVAPGSYPELRAHILMLDESADGYAPIDTRPRNVPLELNCPKATPTGETLPTATATATTAPTATATGETLPTATATGETLPTATATATTTVTTDETPAPTGDTLAETGTPKTTLPPTSTDGSGSSPADGTKPILLGLALVIIGALVLSPKAGSSLRRR